MVHGVARLYASALRGCGRQQEAKSVVQVKIRSTCFLFAPFLSERPKIIQKFAG